MRIRVSYKKESPIRFTSTLDMQNIWEQSLRRAGICVEYSKGFHPQPRIQLGLPLPLGFTGLDEKVDIWIENSLPIEEIKKRLPGKLPGGLIITSIQEILLAEKSLSSKIRFSDYTVFILTDVFKSKTIQNKINDLLNKKEIISTKRNGKTYNLRSLIHSIEFDPDKKDHPVIHMRLLSQQNNTGRADVVMVALGFSLIDFIVERNCSFS